MRLIPIGLALLLTVAGGVAADERPADDRHFSGKEAATLKDAVRNLTEGNEQLAAYLEGESVEAADLGHIHELTYTLENAIAKIQEDLVTLATTLEEVHLASERGDADVVLESGRAYLSIADPLNR